MAMFRAPKVLAKELGRPPTTDEEAEWVLREVEKRLSADSGEAAD